MIRNFPLKSICYFRSPVSYYGKVINNKMVVRFESDEPNNTQQPRTILMATLNGMKNIHL